MDLEAVKRWRRTERERLIALRQAVPADERRRLGAVIGMELRAVIATVPGILGVYWPFRAEFDPRPLIEWAVGSGRMVALPVVIDKKGPLEYRAWRPGETLVDGVWNIPIPEKREIVVPALVLAPLVGFDRACYRLGYGGGYFDRTLAVLRPRPRVIGVGYERLKIRTIYPQPHDIPLERIITEG